MTRSFSFLLAILVSSADASVVTYEFSGTARGALLDGNEKYFNALLSWDTETTDSCLSPEFGCYSGAGVKGFSLTYAGFDLITSPILGPSTLGPSLNVYRPTGPRPNQFRFGALLPAQLGFDSIEATIQLLDSSKSVFPDDSLPGTLDLTDFSSAQLTMSARPEGNGSGLVARNHITRIARVPLPPTVMLVFGGLLLVARTTARRSNQRP